MVASRSFDTDSTFSAVVSRFLSGLGFSSRLWASLGTGLGTKASHRRRIWAVEANRQAEHPSGRWNWASWRQQAHLGPVLGRPRGFWLPRIKVKTCSARESATYCCFLSSFLRGMPFLAWNRAFWMGDTADGCFALYRSWCYFLALTPPPSVLPWSGAIPTPSFSTIPAIQRHSGHEILSRLSLRSQ